MKSTTLGLLTLKEMDANGWRVRDRNGRVYRFMVWIEWRIGHLSYNEHISGLAMDAYENGERGKLTITMTSGGIAVITYERTDEIIRNP